MHFQWNDRERELQGQPSVREGDLGSEAVQEHRGFSWVALLAEARMLCIRLVMTPGFGLLNAALITINAIVLGLNWCVRAQSSHLHFFLCVEKLDGHVCCTRECDPMAHS